MKHSRFKIGLEFMSGAGRWRCTDVGTRIIAAIRLDLDHDPSWYNGPPYAVTEMIFDEDGMEDCVLAPQERTFDDSGKPGMVTIQRRSRSTSAFDQIRAIDYTVILVRDMARMRQFYEETLCFSVRRELSPNWIEYSVGANTLALARPSRLKADAATPQGSASLQLAFRVSPTEVDRCADELVQNDILLLEPPRNQSFGHRTLFFRDPDGNLLEVFADIPPSAP